MIQQSVLVVVLWFWFQNTYQISIPKQFQLIEVECFEAVVVRSIIVLYQLSEFNAVGRDYMRSTYECLSCQVVQNRSLAKLKSVVTIRSIDLFVLRLHPSTSGTELDDCVQEVASHGNVEVGDINSVKLQLKFESLYSSFHVSMRVNVNDLSHALKLFMDATSWPCGTFAKRYYKLNNGSTEQ